MTDKDKRKIKEILIPKILLKVMQLESRLYLLMV